MFSNITAKLNHTDLYDKLGIKMIHNEFQHNSVERLDSSHNRRRS